MTTPDCDLIPILRARLVELFVGAYGRAAKAPDRSQWAAAIEVLRRARRMVKLLDLQPELGRTMCLTLLAQLDQFQAAYEAREAATQMED